MDSLVLYLVTNTFDGSQGFFIIKLIKWALLFTRQFDKSRRIFTDLKKHF